MIHESLKNRKTVILLVVVVIVAFFVALKFLSHELSQNQNLRELTQRVAAIDAADEEVAASTGSEAAVTAVGSEVYAFDLAANALFHGEASEGQMGDYQLCFTGVLEDGFSEIHIGKGIESEPWGGLICRWTVDQGVSEWRNGCGVSARLDL